MVSDRFSFTNRSKIIRIASFVIFGLIILIGLLKDRIRIFFGEIILVGSNYFNIDLTEIIHYLNQYSPKTKPLEGIIGWFIYYPLYFLLHIILVNLIFYRSMQTRKILSIALIAIIVLLIILSVFGFVLNIQFLYQVGYHSFRNLLGLPFILLALEGGRILYNDMKRLTE